LSGQIEEVPVPQPDASGYHGHGGGDFGIVESLHDAITLPPHDEFSREDWFESHLISFAAEQSRLSQGTTIDLDTLRSA
jgi:hypothetical protein